MLNQRSAFPLAYRLILCARLCWKLLTGITNTTHLKNKINIESLGFHPNTCNYCFSVENEFNIQDFPILRFQVYTLTIFLLTNFLFMNMKWFDWKQLLKLLVSINNYMQGMHVILNGISIIGRQIWDMNTLTFQNNLNWCLN